MTRLFIILLRCVIFVISITAYWMETAADWIIGASARTQYVRRGKCIRCGKCCLCLALEMPRWIAKRKPLVDFFIAWHRVALNFNLILVEDGHLIYRCGYFKYSSGCTIHPFRHRICRLFPHQRLYGHPELDPECGYRFEKRHP